MCTIAVALRVHPDHPLILAANRDEFYQRPALPPGPLAPRIIGGKDAIAGGTWLALRDDGAFAAVTNQRNFMPRYGDRRSRGELPVAILERELGEMAPFVRALDPAAYNDGNLIFGSKDGVWVAYLRADPPSLEVEEVPHGIHVLTNDKLGSPDFPRADHMARLIAPAMRVPWSEASPLIAKALADHERPPDDKVGEAPPCAPYGKDFLAALQQICIHTPAYGTRSSTIAAVSDRIDHYLHAEGHPCEHPFHPVAS